MMTVMAPQPRPPRLPWLRGRRSTAAVPGLAAFQRARRAQHAAVPRTHLLRRPDGQPGPVPHSFHCLRTAPGAAAGP